MRSPDDSSRRTAAGGAVLVHLAAGIGNLVLATPLLVALDALGYEVDLLLHADYPQAADLFRDWSVVRGVYAGRAPERSRYRHLLPAVPPFYWSRLGGAFRGDPRVVARPPHALFHEDEQRWYLAFAGALGWPADRHPVYRLPVAPSEAHGVTAGTVVLAPGCKTGAMAAKRWPYYAELAERFADVLVVGTEDDLSAAGGGRVHFPAHVRTLAGRLTLRETAEALAVAGAVVANDSGLGHVAGAVGAPTLLLFGPTSERVLGRFPSNVRVLRAGLPCEPCWTAARLRSCARTVDCLRALDVDRVAAEVHRLLGDTAAPAPLAAIPPPPGPVPASVLVGPAADPGAPLVSCLMPTRDRRAFVPHAIAQFLAQDYPRRELLVLDDGAEPVADLVPDDRRIRYARVEPVPTLGAKRNLACSLAAGDLLAHWDDDDWMAPWRLSHQVAALEASGAEACGLATLRFFDPEAGRAWEYRYPSPGRPWVAGGTLLFRRSLWNRHRFPEIREGEDTRFVWSLPSATLLKLLDPRFYAALIHPGNTSRRCTSGANWHPIPLKTVRAAIGKDWEFYSSLGQQAEPRFEA
jgi:hypothetical protein